MCKPSSRGASSGQFMQKSVGVRVVFRREHVDLLH
jgi:hypothetical protein